MGSVRWIVAAALLCAAGAAPAAQTGLVRTQGRHSWAESPNAVERYARSFVKITDAAWEAYRDLYGLPLAEPIQIHVALKGSGAALWTDGDRAMFLQVGSEASLKAPAASGAHHVYGMVHELGHMAIYRRMRSTGGLPDGVGEGWAHYFGSILATRVYETLGAGVYPDPHNYSESSGMPRLLAQFAQCEKAGKWDPDTRTAKVLYDVEQKYGRKRLSDALNKALDTRPSGAELVKALSSALVAVTKDPQSAALIPEQFLLPKVEIDSKDADIARPLLFGGLKGEWASGELRLSYGDGTREDEHSFTDTGHGVIFCRPEGRWQLTAVELHGCRFGSRVAPQSDFSIFLCDERFRVLREARAPYSRFPRTREWKWERIEVEPTEVPAFFYIVACFDPTTTRGVFVGVDTHIERSHSRTAYPNSVVGDVGGTQDWMMRCVLNPADNATEARAARLAKKLVDEVNAAE